MAKKSAKDKARDKVRNPKPQLTPEQQAQKRNDEAVAGLYGAEGVNAGNALINKFAKEGQTGRVSTDVPGAMEIGQRNQGLLGAAGASTAETEALANMKAGLGGYTSPEYQAQREQMTRGINSNTATSLGQLAKNQARGKVYGAAASAQVGNLATAAQNSKDNLEQDLMIKNIDEMRSRNQAYGQFGAESNAAAFGRQSEATQNANKGTMDLGQATLDREKINLGQANAELASQVGLYTGAGSTALQKAKDKANNRLQQQALASIDGGGRRQQGASR